MSKKIDRHCIVCGKLFEGHISILDRHTTKCNRERNRKANALEMLINGYDGDDRSELIEKYFPDIPDSSFPKVKSGVPNA